jgi:hypothetical protein
MVKPSQPPHNLQHLVMDDFFFKAVADRPVNGFAADACALVVDFGSH